VIYQVHQLFTPAVAVVQVTLEEHYLEVLEEVERQRVLVQVLIQVLETELQTEAEEEAVHTMAQMALLDLVMLTLEVQV
jgi:hypothetical protein